MMQSIIHMYTPNHMDIRAHPPTYTHKAFAHTQMYTRRESSNGAPVVCWCCALFCEVKKMINTP